MNTRSLGLVFLMSWAHVVFQAGILGGKASAEFVYSTQASALVYQTISTEFARRADRPGDVSVTVTFQLDPQAHVHNLVIIPRTGGQWAEDAARKAFNTIRFQPAPKGVFEGGKQLIQVRTNLVGITSGTS